MTKAAQLSKRINNEILASESFDDRVNALVYNLANQFAADTGDDFAKFLDTVKDRLAEARNRQTQPKRVAQISIIALGVAKLAGGIFGARRWDNRRQEKLLDTEIPVETETPEPSN